MAETNSTAPKSFDVAIDMLFDVSALIECAESQLEADGGNPAVRILRIAFDKLKTATNLVDDLSSKHVGKSSSQSQPA